MRAHSLATLHAFRVVLASTVKGQTPNLDVDATGSVSTNSPNTSHRAASNHGPLPPPSAQQAEALRVFRSNHCNLLVNACAGSGKTTLILQIAQQNPDTIFLVLTYNKDLASATRVRAKGAGLSNVHVYTMHSYGFHFYSTECQTDQGLKRVFQKLQRPKDATRLPNPGVIVVDEAQDLTPTFKMFLEHVMKDTFSGKSQPPPRLVFLGDPRQEIYEYKDADHRFLTNAPKEEVFGHINSYPWENITLDASNRLTPQMTDFIRNVMLRPHEKGHIFSARPPRLNGKRHLKPLYIIGDPYKEPYEQIQRLRKSGYSPEEILVLAPSIRQTSATPLKALVNQLAAERVPVYIPDFEESGFNDEAARGKISCCTFHQSKGIERRAVIVLDFDGSYPRYQNIEAYTGIPNPIYVAVTRASEELILIQNPKNGPLPTLNTSKLLEYSRFQIKKNSFSNAFADVSDNNGSSTTSTTSPNSDPVEMYPISHLLRVCSSSTEFLERAVSHLHLEPVVPPGICEHNTPQTIKDTHNLRLPISPITGTAAPSLQQYFSGRGLSLLNTVIHAGEPGSFYDLCLSATAGKGIMDTGTLIPAKQHKKLKHLSAKHKRGESLSVSDILFVATIHDTCMNGYNHKLHTIPDTGYNWLTRSHVKDIISTIGEHVPRKGKVKYERLIIGNFASIKTDLYGEKPGIVIQGIPDIVIPDERRIVEVKYGKLRPEHLIQAAMYAAILTENQRGLGGNWSSYVLSVTDGQYVKISPKTERSYRKILQQIVNRAIIQRKLEKEIKSKAVLKDLSDEEFLAQNRKKFSGKIGETVVPDWLGMVPTRAKTEMRLERWKSQGMSLDSTPQESVIRATGEGSF
ncbi:P-loop containing nucleoside triphosphate hydrolase protein [Ascodesmis nigricans]|uniref:P-loop containing nucleoside triphosphate hydrolase protein n=1 Tax=Ascodesmis nigricans TaxID=341454 RepID=A0A4S2N5U1_9PEZI|nr:P-loop containing nucleoside triphosphate hydrolase protein [Ascodesmis nigricans]